VQITKDGNKISSFIKELACRLFYLPVFIIDLAGASANKRYAL
jgi:hypothetical protein